MGCSRGVAQITRPSLVLDASVGVKWFSRREEPDLLQADLLLDSMDRGEVEIWVPDLFMHEVANALTLKSHLSGASVELAIQALFALSLHVAPVNRDWLLKAAAAARRARITVYDACYCVLSADTRSPLLTANPRHQGKARQLGCQVIPLSDWKGNLPRGESG